MIACASIAPLYVATNHEGPVVEAHELGDVGGELRARGDGLCDSHGGRAMGAQAMGRIAERGKGRGGERTVAGDAEAAAEVDVVLAVHPADPEPLRALHQVAHDAGRALPARLCKHAAPPHARRA